MKSIIVRALVAGLLAGTALAPALADEKEAWRLFVSDHGKGVVNVVDPVEGKSIDRIEIKGPANLYRTESGELVFAVQGTEGSVQVIDTGIAFEDHGDHGDIEVAPARLIGIELAGAKPAHFVERQGNIAMWFDGEPTVRLLSESDVAAGKADAVMREIGAPHHGVAVPVGRNVVASVPDPEDASQRPIGARAMDEDGKQIGEVHECPGLHGSAGSGNLHALACGTGLLLIRDEGGIPQVRHLAYASSLPEGSASTLVGGQGLQYFVGNYGADRVVLIDPAEGSFRLVQLPTRRVHFAVDPVRSRFFYVFTEDGKLNKVDFLSGEIAGSIGLTEPYSMDGHWSDPRPRVAVAGDRIVVTDPLKSVLHVVDAETFTRAGDIAVEGAPFNIVAVGGSGEAHKDD